MIIVGELVVFHGIFRVVGLLSYNINMHNF